MVTRRLILQVIPMSLNKWSTRGSLQNVDKLSGTLIIYHPQHRKSRTEPGNQKTNLAAVLTLAITWSLILQVTLMSLKKWFTSRSLQKMEKLSGTLIGRKIDLLTTYHLYKNSLERNNWQTAKITEIKKHYLENNFGFRRITDWYKMRILKHTI